MENNKKAQKNITLVLLAVYLLAMIWIILFKMSMFNEIFRLDRIRSINLIPFHYDEETAYHKSEVMMNMIIFAPLGIYLKMLKTGSFKTILFGFGISILFETLQFIFGIGASDITDVITNTAGTAAGVGSYGILNLFFKNTEKIDGLLRILAVICTLLMILLFAILLISNK
ncbi:MAG: VanZ family protein [Lachnospiraceae bacterium]|nr:VanZ family protein [Lachnospiraceae bacterium]